MKFSKTKFNCLKILFAIISLLFTFSGSAQFQKEINYPFEVNHDIFMGQLYIYVYEVILDKYISEDEYEYELISLFNRRKNDNIKSLSLKRGDKSYFCELNENHKLKCIIKNDDTAYYDYNEKYDLIRIRRINDTVHFSYNGVHQIVNIRNNHFFSLDIEWNSDVISKITRSMYSEVSESIQLKYDDSEKLLCIEFLQPERKPSVEKYQYDSLGRISRISGIFSNDEDTTYLNVNYGKDYIERCHIDKSKCESIRKIEINTEGMCTSNFYDASNSVKKNSPKVYFLNGITNKKERIFQTIYSKNELEYSDSRLVSETLVWKSQKDKKDSVLKKKYTFDANGLLTKIEFRGDQAEPDWEITYTYF